ncbi:hypothetical protein BKA93DRAFT_752551 [Sparassis latifolia]
MSSTVQDPDNFDEIIEKEIVPNLPERCLRYFVTTPALHAKAMKKKSAKEKRKASKGRKSAPSVVVSDDSADEENMPLAHESEEEDESASTRNKKKQKIDNKEVEVTAYIHVIVPAAASSRPSKSKPTPDTVVKRGPFFFKLHGITLPDFLSSLATATPCRCDAILVNKCQWKFETPKNAELKPLSDENSFKAMLTSLGQRKKDLVIIISMPEPAKAAVPWETGDDEDDGPQFVHDGGSEATPFQEQKASLDTLMAPRLAELREKYPVGNSFLFPGKRIYRNDSSHYWELTDLRLQVSGKAIVDAPPNSNHFSQSGRLKLPSETNAIAPVASAASSPGFPQVMPSISTATGHGLPQMMSGTSDALMHACLLQLVQQQQQQSNPLSTLSHLLSAALSNPLAPTNPSTVALMNLVNSSTAVNNLSAAINLSSNSTTSAVPTANHNNNKVILLPRDITVAEFCAKYKISKNDCRKLEKLEVILGDRRCEDLEKEIWSGDAGFSKLGWDRFCEKHALFCDEVLRGLWDT